MQRPGVGSASKGMQGPPAAGQAVLPLGQVDGGKVGGGPVVEVAEGAGKAGAVVGH